MEEAVLAKVEAREQAAMTRVRALAAALHLIPADQVRRARRRQQARKMLDRWEEMGRVPQRVGGGEQGAVRRARWVSGRGCEFGEV